ncbi:MAG TPA: hypothetical protein VEK08_25180 [Planctomycetota bacterium]|nr:hypothetical protein [Planctomycetota bacterium]
MEEVINAALSFPAVLFTVLMGFVALFWTSVIIGGIDPNSLDPDVDADVDAHVDVDHADVHADHGDAHHADGDADGHGHDHGGLLSSVLAFLNFGTVPLSMIGSAGVLFGWVSTMLMQLYLQPTLVQMMPAFAAGTVIFGASTIGSLISAGLATRPLRGAFKIQTFEAGDKLIDQVCKVTTSRVDGSFGEARLETDGAPILLSVRCRRANKLTVGMDAVIVGYDEATNIYEIGELVPQDERSDAAEAAPQHEKSAKKNSQRDASIPGA